MQFNYNLFKKISKHITLSFLLGLSLFTPTKILADNISSETNSVLANGIHLYGQSPERDRLGVEYLVFAVNNNKIVGAFYQPLSEFNCFYGGLDGNKIILSILDPYDGRVHPYFIALQNSSPLASQGDNVGKNFSLVGYHAFTTVNDNELEMLNTCQEQFSDYK